MVGQTVGKYRIVSRLGRGGMGTVYKAVDETLDREVAIKCLNPDLADPETLKRFRAEAVTLAKLNHPNIAMLFELTEHEGQLLMVMEFVRGETFEVLSQMSGPLPIDRSRDLCIQVLDALAHAHRAGIVHRDLKPANLMLTESGLTKVMDFGLARMAGTERLTNDGYMIGTPAYMAPEQVLATEVDGRADLYAMGVVLFRLLTGQLPFKADSGISMAHKQVHDKPTPVRRLRTELPDVCEEIMERALAKAPQDRFQTAEEFKAALSSLDGNACITIPVEHPTVVLRRKRRRITINAAIGVLLLAAVPAGGLVAWRVHVKKAQTTAGGAPAVQVPPAPVPAPPPSASKTASTSSTIAPDKPNTRVAGSSGNAAVDRNRPVLPTVAFEQLKLLLIGDGKPHDRNVTLRLGADELTLVDGATSVDSARYDAVVALFHSHSRDPRWTQADGTVVSLAKVGGKLSFLKGAPDWVTVRTKTAFIPIRVPDGELARLVSELETRTGMKVVNTR